MWEKSKVETKNEVVENCKKIKFELTSLQRSWIVSFFPDHILPIVFLGGQFLLCTARHLYLILPENKIFSTNKGFLLSNELKGCLPCIFTMIC